MSAAARRALARRVRGLVADAGAGVHAKAQTAASTSTTVPSSSAPRVERDGPAWVARDGVESTSAASACPQLQRPPVCAAHVSMWMESPIGHLLALAVERWNGLGPVDVVVRKLKAKTCGKDNQTFGCVRRERLPSLVVVDIPLGATKTAGHRLLGDPQLLPYELKVMHAQLLVALVVMSIVALVASVALVY